MTLWSRVRSRLQARLRAWLGLSGAPIAEYFRAIETRESKRHQDVLATIGLLGTKLENAHVFEKVKPARAAAEYDWEQVQALQLTRTIEEDANAAKKEA